MTDYLTTKEVAALLRIKERKLYDLASKGRIPCSRAMGKLLFSREAVEAWVAKGGESAAPPAEETPRPAVVLGSHDPLLDWALRESGAGLATYFDGSYDGIDRFARREGIAAGLHVFDAPSGAWNVPDVRKRLSRLPVVLAEWAWRSRGLLMRTDDAESIRSVADLQGRRVACRQSAAGTSILFERLVAEAGIGIAPDSPIARTETDAALAVVEGRADATFGLEAVAVQHRLGFVPVVRERYDLLVDRRAWFEPPWQGFIAFTRSEIFTERASSTDGYDVSGLWTVHFNGG